MVLRGINGTVWGTRLLPLPEMKSPFCHRYVLLECFKWISMYFKAKNAINPYNIDSL